MRPFPALLVALLALPLSGSSSPAPEPEIVIWAWERPEDLRFLDGHDARIAFFATTLRVRADGQILAFPRRQPLRVAPDTELTAVVRIEADATARLDEELQDAMVAHVREAAALPGVDEVQIDFDARHSQRQAYVSLLHAIRGDLPSGTRLSMTALASWCVFDRWIDAADPPVDEVVPMVFAMGHGGPSLRARLASDRGFRSAACRGALGLATWEPSPDLPAARRVYFFHDASWTPLAYERARERLPR